MNSVLILKIIVGCIVLFFILFFLIERFYIVGKVYTGAKTTHFQNGEFVIAGAKVNDKSFRDLLRWRFGENQDKPWTEPYSTSTIELTPIDTDTRVRATFINHATVLIETASTTIITDPIFSERAGPFSFTGPKRHHDPYVSLDSIPHIDFVLISHAHYDHLSIQSIRMIEKKFSPHYIVPLNNGQFIERAGVPKERITEIDLYESYTDQGGSKFNSNTSALTSTGKLKVTLEYAQHWSARGTSDRNRYLWGSFVIEIAGKKIFYSGDTGYSTHFSDILKKYSSIDLALMPIGAYEPRWFMQTQHMNPAETIQAGKDLGEPPVMGVHFGTFKLTDEGRHDPEKDTLDALKNTGYNNTFLVPTIQNGLSVEL